MDYNKSVLDKLVLNGRSFLMNSAGLMDFNGNPQQSILQLNSRSKFASYGCCAFLKNSRGNYRVMIPKDKVQVSTELKDRWIEELIYLFGMNVVEETPTSIQKLVESGDLSKSMITEIPKDFSLLVTPLYSLFKKVINTFFEEYKEILIKNFSKYYSTFEFKLYSVNKAVYTSVTSSEAKCLDFMKSLELDMTDEKYLNLITQRYLAADILLSMGDMLKIISNTYEKGIIRQGILRNVTSVTMGTLFNPYGLLLDSSGLSNFKCKSHNNGTRAILTTSSSYTGINPIQNYLRDNTVVRWFHSTYVNIPEFLELEQKMIDLVKDSEEAREIKDLLTTEIPIDIYKVKIVNKCKLIPHTLIRALWTPKVNARPRHFIEHYFEYRDKYPQLDPYFLMNVCSGHFYGSSYGTPSSKGGHLYIVPKVPIDEIVKRVKEKARPNTTTEVREFYTNINNVADSANMYPESRFAHDNLNSDKYMEFIIGKALALYDK